ncbi:MAG: DNA polymerase I [Candidatus Sumerlaeia bacterium]|nr:DNA polymerase I [Candidatus Sumerlaeia bacterium]
MMPKTLYIIDGHSQLFKAYYAIKRLSNSRGLPTNAIYGFVQMLNKLLREQNPEYLVVVFDAPGPTFRDQLYKEYKANRPPAPPDLNVQMPWVKKILAAMGIMQLEVPGVEADDIIGALAQQAANAGIETIIVSADKDLFQLISDKIKVLRQQYDEFKLYTPEEVQAETGVPPEKITDLLGLVGDPTDNIPGVPQIGPKTASKILANFGSVEELYDNLEKVDNPKWRELLLKYKEDALVSKKLATIKKDIPPEQILGKSEFDLEQFRRSAEPQEKLMEIYRKLEFQSLLKQQPKSQIERKLDYKLITTREELRELVEKMGQAELVAFDTETTSSNPMEASLVGVSLSMAPNTGYYIPIGHKSDFFAGELKQLPKKEVLNALQPLLESSQVKKTAHNAKYDIIVLAREGLRPQGIYFDTMLASYLLHPERQSHNLKELAHDLLGIQMTPIKELIGTGKDTKTMDTIEPEKVGMYACQDADTTLQLTQLLKRELQETNLWELFTSLEMPLMEVLVDMEMAGVRIDREHFQRLSQEVGQKLQDLAQKIYAVAGCGFNISSPKQVAEVLFDKLKLKPVKAGKTGYSTDTSVLEQLSSQHPLPGLLVEYRTYEKLKTTYIDTLPRIVNPRTGKIHTTFNQSGSATGRLISSDPNLQNIPVRTPIGKEIRRGFIPSYEDWILLSADYSQIDLRMLAHLSRDSELVNAFKNGRDIHCTTASKIFGVSEDAVTEEMRQQAKVINFGIIYGMGAPRLMKELKVSKNQAEKFISDYFNAYSGVKKWIEQVLVEARKSGYVTTVLNRRRYLPDINSPNPAMRSAAERIAINTPVQGSSADLIKRAMLAIHRRLQQANLRARMIIQIHDELIFDLPESELETVMQVVKEEMEQALELAVPLTATLKWGKSWADW